ncbi:hypothetical protein [Pedobacter sp.]
MKKKSLIFCLAVLLTGAISFTANAVTEEGSEFSFTTSCGTHTAVFYGTPSQQWSQAVAYAESFSGCGGEVPFIIRLAPAENPPS